MFLLVQYYDYKGDKIGSGGDVCMCMCVCEMACTYYLGS